MATPSRVSHPLLFIETLSGATPLPSLLLAMVSPQLSTIEVQLFSLYTMILLLECFTDNSQYVGHLWTWGKGTDLQLGHDSAVDVLKPKFVAYFKLRHIKIVPHDIHFSLSSSSYPYLRLTSRVV